MQDYHTIFVKVWSTVSAIKITKKKKKNSINKNKFPSLGFPSHFFFFFNMKLVYLEPPDRVICSGILS